MKAAVYTKYGLPTEVLKLTEVEKPSPKDNEVLVKIRTASINSWDWDLVRGLPRIYRLIFGLFKPKYNIPGIDMAGTVEAIGKNVTVFKAGDEVFGDISESAFGAFAEYTCAKEKNLRLKPAEMSFEHASTLPHGGGLAYQGLFDRRPIKQGDKILINGAGGCAGPLALQMAKMHGAEVTAVDSALKLPMLKELGADHTIDYQKEDFTKNGQKYDLILELIGKRPIRAYKPCLTETGTLSVSGGTISCILQAGFIGPLLSSKKGKKLGILMHRPNTTLNALTELYLSGKLKPVIDKNYPLEKTNEAIERLGLGNSIGKIVINVTS